MNCFQKLLSSWWRTTKESKSTTISELWIAFKNYYLRDEGQQNLLGFYLALRCELLSKIIIFVMKDNPFCELLDWFSVVNCFQKLLSSWWRTTNPDVNPDFGSLWIAFKNYYLRDEGQRIYLWAGSRRCCELLSKIIIFVMKDNWANQMLPVGVVVNCFQKLLSSWWRTTSTFIKMFLQMLWIAFKNYYLRDEGQLKNKSIGLHLCCELLSKIIIFVMKDNKSYLWVAERQVVNCFQKLLSSWWRTTQSV